MEFLQGYGAECVELRPGGRHPAIHFRWNGGLQFYTIAGTSSDAYHATRNAVADLKRRLGEPIAQAPTPVRRRLEDMTSSLASTTLFNPMPIQVGVGTLARYTGTNCLTISFPQEIVDAFVVHHGEGPATPIRLSRAGDSWEIRYDPAITKPVLSKGKKLLYTSAKLVEHLGYFRSTPAEFLLTDGVILFRMTEEPRQQAMAPKKAPKQDKAPSPVLPDPSPPQGDITEAFMRDTLASVRRIEMMSPYRLLRRAKDEAWVFSAPRIE